MRLHIASVRAMAASRPPGYLEDVLSRGTVDGDWIELGDQAAGALAAKYARHGSAPKLLGEVVPVRQPPGLLAQGLSVVVALGRWASEGFPVVTPGQLFDRSAHCALCPSWDALAGRCLSCGCYSLKHHLATERCPLGRWASDPSAAPPPPPGS
jgi:hypothetical protein